MSISRGLYNKIRTLLSFKFIRFGIVGGIGFLTNILVFYFSRKYLEIGVSSSAVVAFTVAVTQNYLLNHNWSFKNIVKGRPGLMAFAKYIVVNLFGLLINIWVLGIILKITGIHEIFAQAFSVCTAMFVNYIGVYIFVFAKDAPLASFPASFFRNRLDNGVLSEIKNVTKKEYKFAILFIIIAFLIIYLGQMIAVIGGRQIIEPFNIKVTSVESSNESVEPDSFRRFMQLARAGNYTHIVGNKTQEEPWKVESVFIKKIIIGIDKKDLDLLKDVDIQIGSKIFHYTKSDIINNWKIFDKSLLGVHLTDVDYENYIVYEAPSDVSLTRSKIPVYKEFFSSLINWRGDSEIFLRPFIISIGTSLLLLLFLIITRIIVLFADKKLVAKNQAVSTQIAHDEEKIIEQKRQFIIFTLTIIFSIGALFVLNFIIYLLYKPNIDLILQEVSKDYVNYLFKSFRPKPVERLQFILSTAFAPFLLFLGYFIISKLSIFRLNVTKLYPYIVAIASFGIFTVVYLGLSMSGFFYILDSYFFDNVGRFIYCLVIFPIILILLLKNLHKDIIWKRLRVYKSFRIILYTILSSVLALVFLMNVISVTDKFIGTNLDPVIYPFSQLVFGKNLLVDLTSFYGLYPFFLIPIFSITGLSVLNFSIVMAGLICISLICIFWHLNQVIKSKFLQISGYFFVVFYSLFATRVIQDHYFQYWPIRFIFPSLSIILVTLYFKNRSKVIYYLTFLTSAIAVLWNFDSGIIVFLSWLIVLFYDEFSQAKRWKSLVARTIKHIGVGLISMAVVISSFAFLTYLRSGYWPDAGLFLMYQKIFLSGYLMIKMLLPPHTWNIIILIYLCGLLLSVRAMYLNQINFITKVICYLSVLGVGLFLYYEGQSSDVTLFRTSYPALLLVIIFADIFWQRIKQYNFRLYGEVIIFICLLFAIASTPFSLLHNMHTYLGLVSETVTDIGTNNSNKIQNINFIKQFVNRGEKVLIIATPEQGIYYVETETFSIIDIPSVPDIAFPKDLKILLDFLNENSDIKVFVELPLDKYNVFDVKIKEIIESRYEEVSRNENGFVLYRSKSK